MKIMSSLITKALHAQACSRCHVDVLLQHFLIFNREQVRLKQASAYNKQAGLSTFHPNHIH